MRQFSIFVEAEVIETSSAACKTAVLPLNEAPGAAFSRLPSPAIVRTEAQRDRYQFSVPIAVVDGFIPRARIERAASSFVAMCSIPLSYRGLLLERFSRPPALERSRHTDSTRSAERADRRTWPGVRRSNPRPRCFGAMLFPLS